MQILLQLKGAGYVATRAGAAGGYELIRPPEDITLGEVMNVIEGRTKARPAPPPIRPPRILQSCWHEVPASSSEMLHSITFAD